MAKVYSSLEANLERPMRTKGVVQVSRVMVTYVRTCTQICYFRHVNEKTCPFAGDYYVFMKYVLF